MYVIFVSIIFYFFGNFIAYSSEIMLLCEVKQQFHFKNGNIDPNPNPNSIQDFFNIKVRGVQATNYRVTINDLTGRQVYSSTISLISNETVVDVRTWSKGLYFVEVTYENGVVNIQKLVVA